MACAGCGQNNFSWARTCAHCGQSLASSPAATDDSPRASAEPTPVPQRDLQLALPEVESPAAQDARMIREALAHTATPVVMPVLLIANVLVFVAMAATGVSPITPDTQGLLRWGGTYAPSITAGEWWRLLTAMFLHAGLFHLLFNMFALLSIGSLVERMFGRIPFLVLYLLSGVGGSLASVYWHPVSVGVGASGAIFGVYGGLAAFLFRGGKSLPSEIIGPLRNSAIGFVLYNTIFGLTRPNIDMAAHFGGLAAGLVAGAALATAAGRPATIRRALTIGVVGAAVLAIATTRLPAFDEWPGAARTLVDLEAHNIDAINDAMQKVTDRRIDAAGFARRLEEQVIVPWRQLRNRIASMKRLPEQERSLAAQATIYMDHRAAAWQLQADAFRTEDMTLLAKSNAEQVAANEAARGLARMLGVTAPDRRRERSTPAVSADAGERDLTKALEVVGQLESTSVQVYNTGLARVRSRALSSSAFADSIEKEICQPWDRQLKVVAALRTSGPVEGFRKRIEEYMRLRGEGWHVMARSFRTESLPLAKQANELFSKASALASTLTPTGTPSPSAPAARRSPR